MKRKKFLIFIIFILVIFSNCAKTPEQKQLIKTGKTKLKIKLEGVVKPIEAVEIIAPATGIVKKVFFQNGDWVNKGDIIYKINLLDVELEIKNLKRQIAYIDSVINRNKNFYLNVSNVKKRLIEIAKTHLYRVASLYSEGYATKKEVEKAEENYFLLIDQIESMKESYFTKRASLIKQKEDAVAKLTKLQSILNNAVVRAPMSGFLVSSILLESQKVVKGTIVGKIYNLKKVIVKAGVASGLYQYLHVGDTVKLDFITTPPYSTYAKITKLIPIVDPKIGRMVAEIVIDNPNYLLQDGTKVLVTIVPNKKVQKELYKSFYKEKDKSVIEIKTEIK